MSSIKIMGLVTGEQIMGKEEVLTDSEILLKNCAIIVPMGDGKLALAAWIPYSTADKEGIVLRKDKIVFTVSPVVEMLNQYSTMFGSGLVVPKGITSTKLSLVE
jgi:hypothetical protein